MSTPQTESLARRTPLRAAALLLALCLIIPTSVSAAQAETQQWAFPGGYEAQDDPASLFRIAKGIRAHRLYDDDVTGAGIDIALIDTGVRPNELLPAHSVLVGPAFVDRPEGAPMGRRSGPDSMTDPNGHGTHLASIMVGSANDNGSATSSDDDDDPRDWNDDNNAGLGDRDTWHGIAPGARVVSLRVTDDDGVASMDQVIEAIEWVVHNRNTGGRNIRVLNLSMAAAPADSPTDDVLAHAVTQAWDAGIVVVAAAGNGGLDSPLASPAYEPRIISVGALDHGDSNKAGDDQPSELSSGATEGRNRPDIWAPGRSIPAAIAPGSAVAVNEDAAHVGDELVRGSGTSQASAVVSASVALLLSARPDLTPDQVAAILHEGANKLEVNGEEVPNARLDLEESLDLDTPHDGPSAITQIVPGYSAADPETWNVQGGHDPHVDDPDYVGARWVGARWVGARWVGARWVGARWVHEGWH